MGVSATDDFESLLQLHIAVNLTRANASTRTNTVKAIRKYLHRKFLTDPIQYVSFTLDTVEKGCPKSGATTLAMVRRFVEFAAKRGLTNSPDIDLAGRMMRRRAEPGEEPDTLRECTLRDAIAAAGRVRKGASRASLARRLCYLLTLMQCGLRRNEARYLRWDEIDFEHAVIRLRNTPDRRLKTARAKRIIPLSPLLLDWLDVLKQEPARVEPFRWIDPSHWLPALAQEIAVPSLAPTLFRHTFASTCITHGVPSWLAARYMGHKHPSTLESNYLGKKSWVPEFPIELMRSPPPVPGAPW